MTPSLLALLLAAAPLAQAQTTAPVPDCVLIENTRAFTPSGWQDGVSVLVRGETIAEIGPKLSAEASCARVDGSGKQLTPGLIEPWAPLGLMEIDQESATRDQGGAGPSLRVIDSYNPRSSVIPITRVRGVTSSVVGPDGPGIAGTAAFVDLAGAKQSDAVQNAAVAMYWAPQSNMAVALYDLRGLLDEARAFGKNRAAWEQNRSRPFKGTPADLEALQPLLRGELPLVVSVNSAADIEALLRFNTEQKLRLVILGGAEAHLMAKELAEARVPVIVDAYVYGPGSFDELHGRADNAALLHAAGVQVMLTARDAHNLRILPQVAGNAVRDGLPYDAALTAICSTPAQVFGLPDHGRIAPGARANLVLWAGDPLELSTRVEAVWIHGRAVPMVSRQTELTERYRSSSALPAPQPTPEPPPPSPTRP